MQSKDIVSKILRQKSSIVIISPHFDDAVLSCGMLMMALEGKVDVRVVNVFTTAHEGPYTLSAKKFLKDSNNESNANDLFEKRLKEDKKALSFIKVKEIKNLGISDALFRRKSQQQLFGKFVPELNHVYPTYRFHITSSVSNTDPAMDVLRTKLQSMKKENVVVLAPYGIGNHVDHQIVRKVCEEVFDNLILYSDFPYNVRTNNYGEDISEYRRYELNSNIDKKKKCIEMYTSQFIGLFPDGKVPDHKEVYFAKK